VIDAVGTPVPREAHLVVGPDVVDPGARRHEALAARREDLDQSSTFVSAEHVRHHEDRRVVGHGHGLSLRRNPLEKGFAKQHEAGIPDELEQHRMVISPRRQ
jgi:hypothetical protein